MMLNDQQRRIFDAAKEHGDRYLLPRHLPKEHPDYKACSGLVEGGYARWLGLDSTLAPGIRLTDKPVKQD